MQYQCGVCGHKVNGDMLVYTQHTETHIVDVIKADHPEWVESSGLCSQCLAYYKGELKGIAGFMHPTRCAQRRARARNFLSRLVHGFKK